MDELRPQPPKKSWFSRGSRHANRGARGRSKLSRIAIRAGVALLSLWTFYLVGMNVFLSTSLFEKAINGDPETVEIHFRRGWSLFPQRIHAEHLSIKASDSNVEWILRLEEVDFDVSFLELARKRFTIDRARGRDVSFRVRQKKPSPLLTDEYLTHLPPVPTFGRLPIRPATPPDPDRWSDADWHLWTVTLRDVVADDVREVWIDQQRFEGRARITGAFYLKPIRSVWVGPIATEVFEGRTTWAGKTIAEDIVGRLDLRVRTFDPRFVDDTGLLRHVELGTDLRFRIPDVNNLAIQIVPDVDVHGPAEFERLRVRVVDGVVRDDTSVAASLPATLLAMDGHRFRGAFELRADVTPASERGASELAGRLHAQQVTIGRDDIASEPTAPNAPTLDPNAADLAATAIGEVDVVDATFDARALDVTRDPFADLHLSLRTRGLGVADARVLDAYLPAENTSIAFEGGAAEGLAEAEIWRAEHRLRGHVKVATGDVAVRVAKLGIVGTSTANLTVDAFDWEARTFDGLHLTARATDGSFATKKPTDPARGRMIDFADLDVMIDAPHVALADPLRTFDAAVAVRRAEVVDPKLLAAYLPKGKDAAIVTGADVGGRAEFEVVDHRARGTASVEARRIAVQLDDLGLRFGARGAARVHDWDWERGDLVLDEARLDVTDVRATLSTAPPGAPALSIARIALRGASPRFAMADPLSSVDVDATLAGIVVRDPRAVDRFLPDGADFHVVTRDRSGATASAELRATIRDHVAKTSVHARSRDIGVALQVGDDRDAKKRLSLRGDIETAAQIAAFDLRTNHVRGGVAIRIDRVAGSFGESATFADRSDFEAKSVAFQGTTADLDVARPSLGDFDFRLRVEGAAVPDATSLRTLLPPGKLAIEDGAARANADITFSPSTRHADGKVEVSLAHAAVRVNQTRLDGFFDLTAELGGVDPGAKTVDVAGSRIAMRDVRVSGSSADVRAWRGDLALVRGSFAYGDRPGVEGHVRFAADDASPILALAIGDSLPKFLTGLVRAPNLEAQADMSLAPHLVAARNVDARGGDLTLRGDYVVSDADRRGAFVVAKGPLSAGVKVGESGASVRLFNLGPWLGKERAAASALHAAGLAKSEKAASPPPPKTTKAKDGRHRD